MLHFSHFKSFKLAVSDVSVLGVGLGWLGGIARGKKSKERKRLSTSASGARNPESPTTDWARAVAMLAAMKKQEELETKRRLPV